MSFNSYKLFTYIEYGMKINHIFLFFLHSGISGKSQILFAIVYLTRYLDLFTTFISFYNTFMKMIFLMSSFGTLYLMYLKFRATYDHNHDSFRIEFLLIPCALLSLLINHDFTVMEVSFYTNTMLFS
jgi:ER lumen protein retaining receptor